MSEDQGTQDAGENAGEATDVDAGESVPSAQPAEEVADSAADAAQGEGDAAAEDDAA